MLSQSQSFDDPRCVKVVVVPVGDNSRYDSQFEAIASVRSLQLSDLPRANFNRAPNSQFFKSLNITNNNGNLLLDYLRYDRVPGGVGDLDDFQSCRRILMIIGVVNYPEIANSVDKVDEDMEYFARRHPHNVLKRILVFNYSFEPVNGILPRAPAPLANDPQSLVILPPEGLCEGGSMVEVHLQEVLTDAIMRVLLTLETLMMACNDAKSRNITPPNMQFATIYDDIDDTAAAASAKDAKDAKNKKQQQLLAIKKKPGGRIRKWMGDLCMQACSPIDALEHYTGAITDCRALNDGMWLASALEGYVASIVLLQKIGLSPEDYVAKELRLIAANTPPVESASGELVALSDAARIMRLLEDRSNEALALYSRSVVYCVLEVECTLRLARLHESDSSLDREQRVMHYVLRAAAVPGLNPQQQIECTLEGALICRRLGMKRKYAFLLYVAALMTAESDNMAAAYSLVSRACAEYGARKQRSGRRGGEEIAMQGSVAALATGGGNGRESHEGKDSKETANNGDIRVVRPSASWVSIRREIFAHAAYIAREVGDSAGAARNAAALLRLMAELACRHKKKCDIMGVSVEEVATCEGDGAGSSMMGGTVSLSQAGGQGGEGSVGRYSYDDASVSSSSSSALAPPMVLAAIQLSQQGSNSSSFVNRLSTMEGVAGAFTSTLQTLAEEPDSSATRADTHFTDMIGRLIAVPKIGNIFKGLRMRRGGAARGAKKTGSKRKKRKKKAAAAASIESAPSRARLNSDTATTELPATSAAVREVAQVLLQSKDYVPTHEQEHAMDMLLSLSPDLPAACPIALPVQLDFLKPRHMPPSARPRRVATDVHRMFLGTADAAKSGGGISERAAASSAFFYDPFAEQRAREKQSKSDGEVAWSVGSLAQVSASLSNPLSVSLEMQVRVCLEGARHVAFSRTVVIPPQVQAMEVEMEVLPEEQGTLTITGLVIFVGNAVHKIAVDANGYPVRGKPEISTSYKFIDKKQRLSDAKRAAGASSGVKTSVYVVAACPLVSVSPCWTDSLREAAAAAVSTVIASPFHMVLHEGERRCDSICLQRRASFAEGGEGDRGGGLSSCMDLRVTVHETLAGSSSVRSYPLIRFGKDPNPSLPAEETSRARAVSRSIQLRAVRFGCSGVGAPATNGAEVAAAICAGGPVYLDAVFIHKEGLQSIVVEVEVIPSDTERGAALYCRRSSLLLDIELRPSISLGHRTILGSASRELYIDLGLLCGTEGCDVHLLGDMQLLLRARNCTSERMLVGLDAALALSSGKGSELLCHSIEGFATTSAVMSLEALPRLSAYTWAFADTSNRKIRSGQVVTIAEDRPSHDAAADGGVPRIAISLSLVGTPQELQTGRQYDLTVAVACTGATTDTVVPNPSYESFEATVTIVIAKSLPSSTGARAAVSPTSPGRDYLLHGKSRSSCRIGDGHGSSRYESKAGVMFVSPGEYRAYAVVRQTGRQVAFTHVPTMFIVK